MNVLLVNDTSNYHSGSAAVIQFIRNNLRFNHKIIDSIRSHPGMKFDGDWDTIDWVLVNGEGTMHHDRQSCAAILEFVELAQSLDKRTAIVNSVWQTIDSKWKTVVQNLDKFSVRDRLSQQYARENFGVTPELTCDFSYYVKPSTIKTQHKSVLLGGTFDGLVQTPFVADGRINLFDHSWAENINRIANSDVVITGRHHEIYACCIAETPFIPLSGNCWKNQGLLANADAKIPVEKTFPDTRIDILNFVERYQSEYEKLWKWLRETKSFSFDFIV